MPRRRYSTDKGRSSLPMFREESPVYTTLPPFASTSEEIRLAVEQNALDRGVLLIKVMGSLQIDTILNLVEELSRSYDMEDYYQAAEEANIDRKALAALSNSKQPAPYPYYFCLPDHLIHQPRLIFYYRNVALLSAKVMRGVGLDTAAYESGRAAPSEATATQLARYFNGITSTLVLLGGVSAYRHIEMMMANLGDSLGGVSRNEVGRVALARVLEPLVRHLASAGRLARIRYSLKGKLTTPEDEDDRGESPIQVIQISPQTDIAELLQRFETFRVIYQELELTNGSRLLLNRQLTWSSGDQSYRIGPDMHSRTDAIDMLWAGELKGGADPAGSDEHWKTATQALQRIREAAQRTGRVEPKLSFMATILVDRVAKELQDWIDQGRLTSVYNLTKMRLDEAEMARFLGDVVRFLGYELE